MDDHYLTCPISHEVMRDPVLAADGQSYERECIERWLASSAMSPVTGAKLPSKMLLPNHALRAVIGQWRERNGDGSTGQTVDTVRSSSGTSNTATAAATGSTTSEPQLPTITSPANPNEAPPSIVAFQSLQSGTRYSGHYEQTFDDHVYAKSLWHVILTIDIVNDYLPEKLSTSVSIEWRKHTQILRPSYTLADGQTPNPEFPHASRQWAVALLSNIGQVHYSKARGPIDMTAGVVDLLAFEAFTGVGNGTMRFFLPRVGSGRATLDGMYWIGQGETGLHGMGLFRLMAMEE